MSAAIPGEDGLARCAWGARPGPMRDYHDEEWGRPVTGEAAWFERLTLEAFQAGLSWATILAKRSAFREVFAGFDVDAVASYDEPDVLRLMADARIVRNRAKIDAAITNARAIQRLRSETTLADLLASFAPMEMPTPVTPADVPTTSPESIALSRELKRRGFAFVGPTTMHALMEATGLTNTHLTGCFRRSADA